MAGRRAACGHRGGRDIRGIDGTGQPIVGPGAAEGAGADFDAAGGDLVVSGSRTADDGGGRKGEQSVFLSGRLREKTAARNWHDSPVGPASRSAASFPKVISSALPPRRNSVASTFRSESGIYEKLQYRSDSRGRNGTRSCRRGGQSVERGRAEIRFKTQLHTLRRGWGALPEDEGGDAGQRGGGIAEVSGDSSGGDRASRSEAGHSGKGDIAAAALRIGTVYQSTAGKTLRRT